MPHTLLLADDSVTIQRVIELTFAEEDVQVVAVSDGDQAIERLESAPPDIVLADIGMPGRNGYEVARYVRQTPKLAHIPVVLLTGAFEPVDQAKATEVGCDGVLAKPFEPQLVIGRVKELLASPVRRAAAMNAPTASAAPAPSYAGEAMTNESPAAPATNLDDYFDQLDTAFASIAAPTAPATQTAATSPTGSTFATFSPGAAAPPDDAVAIEESPTLELPLSYASPAPAEPVAAAPVQVSPPPPVAPAVARELPSVAEAFAAILAAEQHEESAARPVWPSSPAAAQGPSAEISEAVVERIVERVLSRLAVGDRVTEVAERLVREEIERIKASIR